MMIKTLGIATLSLLPLAGFAAGKHVHGEANLFIAIEGKKVVVELESPAANIIGFEHKPHDAEEKQAVKQAITALNQYQTLLSFSESSCRQLTASVEQPFADNHEEHGHQEHHKDHDDHHDKHAHDDHKEHHDDHDDHKDHHDKHAHDEHKEDHDDHADKETHSEFHAEYTLECSGPAQTATIKAFSAFPGIEVLTVNWVNGDQQGSSKVTTNTEIKLTK